MLTTSVERLEGTMVKLTVTVPAAEVDYAIADSYKKVASQVRLPGFRPGKAPRPMIDNAVGRDYVLAEATEALVNETYSRALDAEDLRPIEAPEVDGFDNVVAGEEYTYVVEVELRPELTLTSADDFAIELPSAEATDEEVDVQLEVTRERFATLEPVEGRGVAAEDFVLLSFVGTVDGEDYEGNTVDKYLYEMNRGLMPAEFDAGIMGVEAGAETRVEFPIPETSSNEEFVGKTAAFDVTVHEIKAKKLPEVDDEFAGNVGFESADEMREDLKKRIELQKTMNRDRLKERRSREELATRLEGDIPETMIMSRQGSLMRDFLTMLEQRGLTAEQYMQTAGVDMDTIEADIREQAIQSLREDLALEALFRAKGLEITDEDVDAEIASVAEATETPVEDARTRWVEMGLMPVLNEQIMHRKAVMWLIENVSVTEEAPEAGAAEAGTKKQTKKKAAKKAEPEATEPEAAESTEE